MRIEDWEIVWKGSLYSAPECFVPVIRGNVFDNPNFCDGDLIYTSQLVDFSAEKVLTVSGSVYELGMISQRFKDYLIENDYTLAAYERALGNDRRSVEGYLPPPNGR